MKNLLSLPTLPAKRKPLRAPAGLGPEGRRLWRRIQAEYMIDDPGGIAHLTGACRCEDDIHRMRETVAKDGDTVTDRFGQKVAHPLLPTIRGLEQVRRQNLRELNLDVEPLKDRVGRPSGK